MRKFPAPGAAVAAALICVGLASGFHANAQSFEDLLKRTIDDVVDETSGQVLWSLKNDTKDPWGFDVPVVDRDAIYVATNGMLLKVAKR